MKVTSRPPVGLRHCSWHSLAYRLLDQSVVRGSLATGIASGQDQADLVWARLSISDGRILISSCRSDDLKQLATQLHPRLGEPLLPGRVVDVGVDLPGRGLADIHDRAPLPVAIGDLQELTYRVPPR
jgi:hypothetical protein